MKAPKDFTWSQLAAWQRSFGSKAAIALPLVSFVFATAGDTWLKHVLEGTWRIHAIFWGAFIFLAGQAVIFLGRPVEFSRDTDVHQDIAEARRFASKATFDSKVDMLEKLIARIEPTKTVDDGTLLIAKTRLAEAKRADDTTWKQHLPKVIIAQRELREMDDKKSRVTAVVLLCAGTVLMALPTAINIVKTAWGLLVWYPQQLR